MHDQYKYICALFCRFTEGFDLLDEQYKAWLRVNHPEQFRQCNDNLYVCDIRTQYTHSESDGGDKSDGQLEGDEQRNLSTFILEQERKYARRFTEGFDLPDEQYEAWLRINHPEQF